MCIESIQRYVSKRDMMAEGLTGACDMVVIMFDGPNIANRTQLRAGMHGRNYESIEYLPPI